MQYIPYAGFSEKLAKQTRSQSCLSSQWREERQTETRQAREGNKIPELLQKKESWPFHSVWVQPPSVFDHQAFRHALEVLLELKGKGETLLLLETQRTIKFPTLAVAPWRKYVSFPVFSWEVWPANFYSNSTNHFRAEARSREAKSLSYRPLLCHRHCTLLLRTQSQSSLISTLSKAQNITHKPAFNPGNDFP